MIGLSVAGVAVGWALNNPLADPNGPPIYSLAAVEVAFVTLIATVFSMIYVRGFLSVIPILFGMVVGYIYTFIRYPEWLDFSVIANAPWFVTPGAMYTEHMLTNEILAAFTSPSAWLGAAIIIPVAFVTLAEHIGHLLVTGNVMNRNLMKDPGLHRTLLGDGLATSLAAFIGGPSQYNVRRKHWRPSGNQSI